MSTKLKVLKKDEKLNTEEVPSKFKSDHVKKEEYNVHIVRDYDGTVDPFYLTKQDPNFAYRFLRDEQKNISLKTSNLLLHKGGWQICPKEHLLRIGIKDSELSPDGLLRRGDTVLAFMPKDLFLEKEKYKARQASEPIDNIRKKLKKGDPSVGGRELHDTMRGIQTQKDLKM